MNIRDAVLSDLERYGWLSVPVPYMAKKPVIERWQELRLDTPEKVSECFNGVRQNRGVLLGDISRGLADVDCDVVEAIPFADYFLPHTREFGHRLNPRSHRLLNTDWFYNRGRITFQYRPDPKRDAIMVVELRGPGHQTVFPPSVHECGEPIEWCNDVDPEYLPFAELLPKFRELLPGPFSPNSGQNRKVAGMKLLRL